jgi:hypothetical protein
MPQTNKKSNNYETFNKLFMGGVIVGLVYLTFMKKSANQIKQKNIYKDNFDKSNNKTDTPHYKSNYHSYHFNSKDSLKKEFKSINIDELNEVQINEWYKTLKENKII